MLARSSSLGLLAALAISLPSDRPATFTLESTGAVRVTAGGTEARYGISQDVDGGGSVLTISLGATAGEGSLYLYTPGNLLPARGRYPVALTWQGEGPAKGVRWFHGCFAAGTPEHPVGMFHGESGWVTITDAAPGRISGEFELRARGFLAADASDENHWVTVWGRFTAEGDSTIAMTDEVAASN